MKKKRLLPLGILAVLVLAALIYTRPMTLEAMFGLDITQSELVYTDYLTVSIDEPGRSVESSEWLRGEERTETLISLLSQRNSAAGSARWTSFPTSTRAAPWCRCAFSRRCSVRRAICRNDYKLDLLIGDFSWSTTVDKDHHHFQSSFGQLSKSAVLSTTRQ